MNIKEIVKEIQSQFIGYIFDCYGLVYLGNIEVASIKRISHTHCEIIDAPWNRLTNIRVGNVFSNEEVAKMSYEYSWPN